MATVSPVDANGTAITVGATVKLVGTVTGINQFDNRLNEITISISHPLSGVVPLVNTTGGDLTVPGYRTTVTTPPQVLVVGS